MQELIERRELENQMHGGKLPPLLKHKRNFKDPANEPKKTFLKDDEELENELVQSQENLEQVYEEDEEHMSYGQEADFERHVSGEEQQYRASVDMNGSPDPKQIKERIKVNFSQERGLKAGRFHDPNALYFKIFEQKPPVANGV